MHNFFSLLLFVDEHCIQMLKDGVVEELGNLLEKHSGRDGDIRMQHAVLSALRNLAIPGKKKLFSVSLTHFRRYFLIRQVFEEICSL